MLYRPEGQPTGTCRQSGQVRAQATQPCVLVAAAAQQQFFPLSAACTPTACKNNVVAICHRRRRGVAIFYNYYIKAFKAAPHFVFKGAHATRYTADGDVEAEKE